MKRSARLIACKIKLTLVGPRAVAFKLAVNQAEKQNCVSSLKKKKKIKNKHQQTPREEKQRMSISKTKEPKFMGHEDRHRLTQLILPMTPFYR